MFYAKILLVQMDEQSHWSVQSPDLSFYHAVYEI